MVRAVSLLLLSLTLSSITVVSSLKCCPPGQVLTANLTCGRGTSHYLLYDTHLDLHCSGRLTAVHPSQDVQVLCLDVGVAVEGGKTDLTGVRCEGESTNKAVFVPEVHYVRKCCPLNRKYTDYRHGCWSEEVADDPTAVDTLRSLFLNDTRSPVSLEIGVPRCAKGAVLRDIFLHHRHVWRQESESIVLKHQGSSDMLLVPEEFCVDLVTTDDYSLVVRACHDATVLCDLHQQPCINKCCGDGQSYQGFSCAATNTHFDVQFYKLHAPQPPTPVIVPSVGIAFEEQSSFKCQNGRFSLDPRAYPDDAFYLSDDGRLLIPMRKYLPNLVGWRDFCLEQFEQRVVPFLCFPPSPLDGSQDQDHFRLIAYGLLLSSGFLLVTLVVYVCLPSLHNLHGLTLMCHVAALLLAYTCLVASQLLSDVIPPPLCAAISYGIQLFFLAAFSWLNVICFDIWWTFGAIRADVAKREAWRGKFVLYSLYAWLLPLTITAATCLTDTYQLLPYTFLPNMAVHYCFFYRGTHGKTLFFDLPVMLQITSNIVFFGLTIRNCSKIKSELRQMQNNSNAKLKYHADINKLAMNTKLFVVMGLTWVCEVVTWYFQDHNTDYWWYLLDGANIFQGFFIFLIFVIKKKVIRAMMLRFHEMIPCCVRQPLKHRPCSSTVFTTTASSDGRLSSQIRK